MAFISERRKYNFVSNPGKNIIHNSNQFINDIKNFNGYVTLMVGSNDADVLSKQTFLYNSLEIQEAFILIQSRGV